MKKYLSPVLVFLCCFFIAKSSPVALSVAKTVGGNYYSAFSGITPSNLALAYTETTGNGDAVYYVFNISGTGVNPSPEGFVIVSAEDATYPVLGYSAQGHFVIPVPGTNVYFWLQSRKNQIIEIRANNIKASSEIAGLWNYYQTTTSVQNNRKTGAHRITSVKPLCQTVWNQSPYYNADCPGGTAVTGCVATAMAQIMKYWNYPAHGLGSSSYSDEQSNGFQNNYGILSANYENSAFLWSSMPDNVTSPSEETQVALLMYDCGVSVQMDYGPSESGAFVLGNYPSAQYSYPTYFGYDSKTLQGLQRQNYNDNTWTNLIETELNASRLVEYAGTDQTYGGHTWVIDGYNNSGDFDMNWGWGGQDDGYFTLNSLTPGVYDFSTGEQMLTGIEPSPVIADFMAYPVTGCSGMNVTFTDNSLIPNASSPITSWNWTFQGGTPSASTMQNPSVTYSSAGTYSVTLTVTNNLGTNTVSKVSYITVASVNNLPLVQYFEGGTYPPPDWSINNPDGHSTTWALYTGTGGFGKSDHSMYYNNCSGGVAGQEDQIFTPAYDYSLVTNPKFYFDVAYAPFNSQYSDTLAVYYSLDCGKTFTNVYLKGGLTLCTTGGLIVDQTNGANTSGAGCFVPLSKNWRTDTIYIPAIARQQSVLFSFENRSGNGSNMYIDNVNAPGTPTAVQTISYNKSSMVVYPNPSNGKFTVQLSVVGNSSSDIEIYNMLGQMVYSVNDLPPTPSMQFTIDLGKFGKGIYMVVLKDEGNRMVQKVAVE